MVPSHPTLKHDEDAETLLKSDSLDPFQSLDGIEDIINDLESPSGTIDEDFPPIDDTASPGTTWRLNNTAPSVHMQVQENAKLPTLNMAIDRTGSSSRNFFGEVSGRIDKDEINLAELFLTTPARESVNANYESSGQVVATTDQELDALLGQVAPTPLSEINERHERHIRKLHQASHNQSQATGALPITKISPIAQKMSVATVSQSGAANLSLPSLSNKSTTSQTTPTTVAGADAASDTMSAAIATAAAIVAKSKPPPPPKFGTTHRSAAPLHSQAHSVPKAALTNASSQQRKYGFGTKHVVPSVPAPPPSSTGKPSTSSTTMMVPMESPYAMSRKRKPAADNGAEAYERKKQRAKNARMRLNEAIEELSIAIQLAGTQSEQRATALKSKAGEPLLQQLRQGACIAQAAKKWDRPSFVGSAATLIHNLNAQADALKQQLLLAQQQLKQQASNQHQSCSATAIGEGTDCNPVPSVVSSPPLDQQRLSSDLAQRQEQRQQKSPSITSGTAKASKAASSSQSLTGSGNVALSQVIPNDNAGASAHTPVKSLVSDSKVLDLMASFADPCSSVQCQRSCRSWRKPFSSTSHWENVLIQRFGFFNVRQWKARTESDEINEPQEAKTAPSHKLYALMDMANVMPNLGQDGVSLLGETRLAGKVSAWTYLVERSNGETLRSVRKPNGDDAYCSMPIVELRTVVQNTGVSNSPIILSRQEFNVDASTRRRGEEMKEVGWDDRFQKRLSQLDGTSFLSTNEAASHAPYSVEELCRLRLFETVVIETYIHAKGCSTTSKFLQRANFTKVLVAINGVTIPLVIPFPRDAAHLLH